MKKVFNSDYPSENIEEISKWIEEVMIDKKSGGIADGMYRPTIIVEIIPNK